jgi:hypothetical protein
VACHAAGRADSSTTKRAGHSTIITPAPPKATSVPISATSNACRSCGAKLTVRKRALCDACFPKHQEEMRGVHGKAFRAAGPAKIAAMRAIGKDPTQSHDAQLRRSASASVQRQSIIAWRDDGSLESVDFRRDILPMLQGLSVRAISEATGSSISHGSKVRNGHLVPHKRHWKALLGLAT